MGRVGDERGAKIQGRPPRLIYVHGANGSGKTTLAHVLMTCAGRPVRLVSPPTPQTAPSTHTKDGLVLVGPYRSATGGADSVQPYAFVPHTISHYIRKGKNVFVEGLMTPGVDTCRWIYEDAKKHGAKVTFIWLDVNISTCTAHVLARRARKGNEKPYDNAHLVKKHKSSFSWAQNLAKLGLPVQALTWEKARAYCLSEFRLTAPPIASLLDRGA